VILPLDAGVRIEGNVSSDDSDHYEIVFTFRLESFGCHEQAADATIASLLKEW
jgi:hypothetical protein